MSTQKLKIFNRKGREDMFERIDALCKAKGITVKALEIELGFSPGTISHWRASMPKADNAVRVAEELGVSVEYLVTGKEKPAHNNVDGLDAELLKRLVRLTPKEAEKVGDFVQGILAAREA